MDSHRFGQQATRITGSPWPCAAVALASGLVVCAAFGLVLYAMPLADDFCRADIRVAWPAYVAQMYRSWTGRWAAMALYAGVLPRIDVTSPAYAIWLAGVWACLLASFFALVRLVWGRHLSLRLSAVCALVFSALFLSGLPSPEETMYWLTGATEYTLPMALSILGIASLAQAGRYPRGRRKAAAWDGIGLGLVLVVTGLHEVAGIILLLVLVTIALVARLERADSAATWRTAAVIVAVGSLVAALAPGNATRLHRDFAGGAGTPGQSLHVLRIQLQTYLLPWMTSGRLALAGLLVLSSPITSTPPAWARRGGRMVLAVVPLAAVASVLAIFLGMAIKVGALGPLRVYDYAYGVFLAGWLVSLVVWSGRLRVSALSGTRALKAILAVLFVLSLVRAPRVLAYAGGLVGTTTAARYQRESAAMYEAFREGKREGMRQVGVRVAPTFPYAFSADSMQIDRDPSNWRNRCVAKFFGLDSVYAAPTHAGLIRGPTTGTVPTSHS